MSEQECTFVTWNIFHDLPQFRRLDRRLELIAEAIASARPHLVALQEVARAAGCGDIGNRLCTLVNERYGAQAYRIYYAPADGAGEGEYAFDEGVAILSRLPATGTAPDVRKYAAQVELTTTVAGTRYRLPDDRVAMRSRFRTDSGSDVDFYVTHLTDATEAAGNGPAVRAAQARELARWVGETSGAVAAVVVGDFNDAPESEAIRSLVEAGFVDASAAMGGIPGYTNDRGDLDIESPVASHNQRIDYIFYRPARGAASQIIDARLFADRPHREADGGWLWPSDHIGISATLKL
jgi:endonuclease/exonuclease/phosphatase family metal-dependent hydrolase